MTHHRNSPAVEGLIKSIDLDYASRTPAGFAVWESEMFQDKVVAALRTMTGQSFGPDSRRWNDWWQTQGQFDPRFK